MKKDRGFTLVELMVAIAILLVVILTIFYAMNMVALKHIEVKEKSIAINLAQTVDSLIESMSDIVIENPSTGEIIPVHESDIDQLKQWLPVVLLMSGTQYKTSLIIPINNVNYTVKAYVIVSPVNSMLPGNPPTISETNIYSKDLLSVAFVISWRSYNGRQMTMTFLRRYYKKGVR